MEKIIHYCWFGGKKLPRKVKKYIKTWKKFLPDYEIKEWNESNFDINACTFVKEAYEKKKWAFVSDYVRIWALYNDGGLYLDTDVKIVKNPSKVLKKDMFFGFEDSGYIGTAVIGVKEKNNKYVKEILEYYNNLGHFNTDIIYSYANPVIITKILGKYESEIKEDGIKVFDNAISVYPREYFYPYSYDYSEKIQTENTCMIHLFNATWASKGEKRAVGINRTFGPTIGNKINSIINWILGLRWKFVDFLKRTFHSMAMVYSIHFHRTKRINKMKEVLSKQTDEYLAICHPEWIGVKNATKYTFKDNVLEVREQYNKKESKLIAQTIINAGKKLVIFNAFAKGWENIASALKEIEPNIKVKLLIHGSNALLSEEYDWNVYNVMLDLYAKGVVDEIGFVKKSLYEFYKAKGYKTSFLMNDVVIENKEQYIGTKEDCEYTKIGLYASGDRWVKNTYNQLSAISLVKNARLDCIPLNYKIATIAKRYDINLTGEKENVPKEEMYKRLANNDINVYVTFTECAPLIPLESLELGTVCVTGDNHHYFAGTELEKYLVVSKEDDIMEIYNKINYALENKEKILELYKDWKINYTKQAKASIDNFLKI